jgi:ketosteroid isomerase-like protein
MTHLSEDPTYLAGGLFLLAGAFLVALKFTQQGKYLIRAVIAAALGLMVIAIEWVWVTDNERIENVVYEVRTAVLKSDVDGVLNNLAPDVMYQRGGAALTADQTRELLRSIVAGIRLEFAHISQLRTSAGQLTRRGNAEFKVFSRGGRKSSGSSEGFTTTTSWSLGFRETAPGIWKIQRITPVSVPMGALGLPGGLTSSEDSDIGPAEGNSGPGLDTRQFPSRPRGKGRRHVRLSNHVETN